MESGYHKSDIPQVIETPLTEGSNSTFEWRYLYSRSAEALALGDTGQDFLTFFCNDQTVIFALCDGVSQSFFGDLAAKILGDALVNWLSQGFEMPADTISLKLALIELLNGLTQEATRVVESKEIQPDSPVMLTEVLEKKRLHGSETTFVCGRIELTGPSLAEGEVILAWMGDTRLRLWDGNKERTADLGDAFHTSERWSSRTGPVGGEPHLLCFPINKAELNYICRLAVYSDGLASLDTFSELPEDGQIIKLTQQAYQSAISDDISFLDIKIGLMAHPVNLMAPASLLVETEENHLHVSWEPVSGASHYQLELHGRELKTWLTPQTALILPLTEPDIYLVRVRGFYEEQAGEWTVPQEVKFLNGLNPLSDK